MTMEREMATRTIQACLGVIRENLESATTIAKAAEACADAGSIAKSIEIALDIDQLVYETTTLLNAASLMRRISEA
jgi:putative N-acetylmannosamine-6-phosphate epimerase